MFNRMNQDVLRSHIKSLIALPESTEPTFSFYLNLEGSSATALHYIHNELSRLKSVMRPGWSEQIDEAGAIVEHFVIKEVHPRSKAAAVFVRGGDKPFYLPLQFQLPLKDRIVVETVPHIVPLVEFNDRYDRYVVLVLNKEETRILEVVLGEVSEQQWIRRPELRERIGSEWTREHYQNHSQEGAYEFADEGIRFLEQVFDRGGYGHLILAGDSKLMTDVQSSLPAHLSQRIVDTVDIEENQGSSRIVMSTIRAFVKQELRDSKLNLKRLERSVLTDGPAAIGIVPCEKAIAAKQVDMLLITSDEGDVCEIVSKFRIHKHNAVGKAGTPTTLDKRREKLVMDALDQGVSIEFVPRGSFLDNFDGVGVLLRYRQDAFESTVQESEDRSPVSQKAIGV